MSALLKTTVITSLTAAALAIPNMAVAANQKNSQTTKVPAQSSAGQWYEGIQTDLKYTRYTEDGPRYDINVWQAHIVVPAERYKFTLDFQRDSQVGASQALVGLGPMFRLPNSTVILPARTGASIEEDRSEVTFKTEYAATDAKYEASLYYSSESDVQTPGISLVGNWYFNKNNTVLIAGAGAGTQKVRPTTENVFRTPEGRKGGDSSEQKFYVALRQDLTKYNYLQLSAEYQHSQGFLKDPYKSALVIGNARAFGDDPTYYPPGFAGAGVYPNGLTILSEKRPKQRNIIMPMLRFVQYIPATDAAAHFHYRFGADDWGLISHTFELQVVQPICKDWQVRPLARYYSQSATSFYGPLFRINPGAPSVAAKPFNAKGWSSDYRLSAYGTLNFELAVSYKVLSKMSLEATAGFYKLKPGWSMNKETYRYNPALKQSGFGAQYFSVALNFKL